MSIILPERVRNDLDIQKAKAADKLRDRSIGTGLSPWSNNASSASYRLRNQAGKGNTWNDYYLMYTRHSFVRAAIDKRANAAVSTSFRYISRDGRTAVKAAEVKKLQAFFDIQPNLLGELNKIYKDLQIYGDAYLYIVPDRTNRPTRLKWLDPSTILIDADDHGNVTRYYQINPNSVARDDAVTFKPDEILHFKISDPKNSLYGLSPLESLRWAVNTDLYAQRYNAAFFKNSGMTGTIISIKSSNTSDIERNKRWLEQHYTGPDAAHTPIILEGDMEIQVHKAVSSQNEMGFLQGRRYVLTEILAVLDVPPTKLGITDSSNRATSKEQDKTFRTESVRALQVLVEGVINEQLILKKLDVQKTIIRHSESDLSDRIELMEYYTKGEAFGVFSPNEVREDLGKPPVSGGDVHFLNTPTGSIPLDQMQRYFQLPSTNEDKLVPLTPADRKDDSEIPKDINVSVPATAAAEKAARAMQDISEYVQFGHDGSLFSAYAHMHDVESDAALTIHKALNVSDETLRKGLIYQAVKSLEGVITHAESTLLDGVTDSESLQSGD